jgi:hypothetical protein
VNLGAATIEVIPGQTKDGAQATGVTLSGKVIVRCACLRVFYVIRANFRRKMRNPKERLQCRVCYVEMQRVNGAKASAKRRIEQ